MILTLDKTFQEIIGIRDISRVVGRDTLTIKLTYSNILLNIQISSCGISPNPIIIDHGTNLDPFCMTRKRPDYR